MRNFRPSPILNPSVTGTQETELNETIREPQIASIQLKASK